jgi:hypothetical protein
MITVGAEDFFPMALFETDFYTDSIRDKPIQMLGTTVDQGAENENQDQFSPSQFSSHEKKYPFIDEFSEFIASVPTEALKYKLMTYQQRQTAKAHWEAQNYGGSVDRCIKHLNEIYGPHWRTITTVAQHMDDQRPYYEYVLILDHQQQWNKSQKLAKLQQTTDLE